MSTDSCLPLLVALVVVCIVAPVALAFPDGAPASVCNRDPAKRTTREPHHGNATAQPAHTLPYALYADADHYRSPHDTIQVTISGLGAAQQEHLFRGFFVQAKDPETGEPVGRFRRLDNAKLLSECATITHADGKDKRYAFLVWQAPKEPASGGGGAVQFSGVIVKDFKTYWTNVTADVLQLQLPY